MLLIYRELNILCVKYSLYSPYGDDVIFQDGASSRCHITDTVDLSNAVTTQLLLVCTVNGSVDLSNAVITQLLLVCTVNSSVVLSNAVFTTSTGAP